MWRGWRCKLQTSNSREIPNCQRRHGWGRSSIPTPHGGGSGDLSNAAKSRLHPSNIDTAAKTRRCLRLAPSHLRFPLSQDLQVSLNRRPLLRCEKQLLRKPFTTNSAQDIAAAINYRTTLWTFWSHGVSCGLTRKAKPPLAGTTRRQAKPNAKCCAAFNKYLGWPENGPASGVLFAGIMHPHPNRIHDASDGTAVFVSASVFI